MHPPRRRAARPPPPFLFAQRSPITAPARFIPPAFVLIWSTGFIGARFGLPPIEPFLLLVLRYGPVLALFGLAFVLFSGQRPNRGAIGGQRLVGTLLHGAYLGGVFLAIARGIPAGLVAIIVGIQPILTAALSRLWLNDRLGGRQAAGLALGFAGVVTVMLGAGVPGGQAQLIGTGLVAAMAGVYLVMRRTPPSASASASAGRA